MLPSTFEYKVSSLMLLLILKSSTHNASLIQFSTQAKHKVQMLLSYSPSFNAPVGQTSSHTLQPTQYPSSWIITSIDLVGQ